MSGRRVIKSQRKILKWLLTLLCTLSILCVPTQAAEGSAVENTATVILPVKQVFVTTADNANTTFQYQLTEKENQPQMPEGTENDVYLFTMTGNSERNIEIVFDTVGIYHYEVKQVVSEQKAGFVYDSKIYLVTVQVTEEEDGGLSALTYVQNQEGVKEDTLRFENSYQMSPTPATVMEDPSIQKIVKGSPSTKSTFTFTLRAADASYPMPTGSVNGSKTVSITGSGTTEFGTWSYTAEGTYTYTIVENNTGAVGYTYDKTVYKLTDVVTEADGVLTLKRSLTSDGKTAKVCVFTNTYSNSNGPKTGDSTDLWLYEVLAVGSLIALIVTIRKDRKQRNTTEKR